MFRRGMLVVICVALALGCWSTWILAKEPITLTFWPSSNPQEIEFAKIIVKKWNDAHPDIQVKMEPLPASRSTEEVLLAAIAAGTTPDVCANIYPGAISQYIAGKGLYAHDTLPGFYDFVYARTPKDVVDAFTYRDGHVYQIPWKGNPIMMAYNVNLLKANGIHPKDLSTYSSFLAAAEKFAKDTNGDGKVDQWLYAPTTDVTWWQRLFDFYTLYIAASQGKTLLKDGKVDFENDAAVQVFEFLQTLFKKGLAPKGSTIGDPFLNGRIGTVITGPWSIPYYLANAPKGFEFDFVPVPVPDHVKPPVITFGDPKNIAIFSNSKHPLEAWEFVKFILSKENDVLWLEITHQPPYRKGLTTDPMFAEYFKKNPMMRKFVEQGVYTRGVDDSKYLIEMFDAISRQYDLAVVQGKKTARQGIKDAARTVKDILAGW
ncbi:MAG: extracellular solute-binding protein [Bacillota bacterium]